MPRFACDFLTRIVLAVQDFYLLAGRAIRNIFRKPHYADDIFLQMDSIGVGSLLIVILTGFFSGAVMALQMARALAQVGAEGAGRHGGFDHPGARTGTGARPRCWWRGATLRESPANSAP